MYKLIIKIAEGPSLEEDLSKEELLRYLEGRKDDLSPLGYPIFKNDNEIREFMNFLHSEKVARFSMGGYTLVEVKING